MNGQMGFAKTICADIASGLAEIPTQSSLLLCPPYVYLQAVSDALKESGAPRSRIALGSQDCSDEDNGAYTGDISASMLADMGVSFVILGHSERRAGHNETSETVCMKAEQAHKEGIITIICVGESEEDRDAGHHQEVVTKQLLESLPHDTTAMNTVIAYEPVWAIGTGKTASAFDVEAMHGAIRNILKDRVADFQSMRILYGGSMKPDNAGELLATPNVDGGLIGGASLNAESFLAIAKAVQNG